MTCSYGSDRTFSTISPVTYRDRTGAVLPVVEASSAISLHYETLQFEVMALRMINATLRHEIAGLKERVAELESGSTYENCSP